MEELKIYRENPYIEDREIERLSKNNLKDKNHQLIVGLLEAIIDDFEDWDILWQMQQLGDDQENYKTRESLVDAVMRHIVMSLTADKQALIKEFLEDEMAGELKEE